MVRVLWLGLAGGAGTVARYLLTVWATERFGPAFPFGTLLVNLAGCFFMALAVEAGLRSSWPETMRLAVTVGFLGGFTTYSSFNFESTRLIAIGSAGLAGTYAVATILGAFAAGWMGHVLGRHFVAM